MFAIQCNCWPIAVAVVVVLTAAVLQMRIRRVPNAFTLPAILAAWILAALFGAAGPAWVGGTPAGSVLATLLAFVFSLPGYRVGIGAGCVKAQMAFGAWIGCALPLTAALAVTAIATFLGAATTYVGCHIALARSVPDEEGFIEFPAQLTHTLGTVAGIAVCGSAALLM